MKINTKNPEHYEDATACVAVNAITEREELKNKVIRLIKGICQVAGFSIQNRLILQDEETGDIYY